MQLGEFGVANRFVEGFCAIDPDARRYSFYERVNLVSDLVLHSDKARDIYEHRIVLAILPPRQSDRPPQEKDTHGFAEALRKCCYDMVDLVRRG